MAINFPDSPSVNDTHTVGDRVWNWNGTYWTLKQNASTYSASDTAPSSPDGGDLWYESDTGNLYVYYGSVWIEVGHATDGGTALADADGDTMIQVEEGTDDDTIRFDTLGVERMAISSTGNVGIGTTAPTRLLDVEDGTNTTSQVLVEVLQPNLATGNMNQIYFGKAAGTNTAATISYAYDSGTPANSLVSLGLYGSSSTLNVTGAGNVGIGTTTPAYPLTVSDGVSAGTFQFQPNGLRIGSNHDGYEFNIVGGIPDGTSMGGHIRLGGATRGDGDANVIQFLQNGTERMRIDDGGNVGIGTTNPGAKLDLGNAGGIKNYTYNNGAGTVMGLGVDLGGHSYEHSLFFPHGSGAGRLSVGSHNGTTFVRQMEVYADGKVSFGSAGVAIDRGWAGHPSITVLRDNSAGTSNATSEFRVHGINNTWASYPAASGADFSVNFRIDGSTYSSSDSRRKTNVENITGALASVNAIQGVSFNTLNSEGTEEVSTTMGGKRYGFIAQDLSVVAPNAVNHYEDEDTPNANGWCNAYSVDYAGMTPLLVEAIKELTARIETLEAP